MARPETLTVSRQAPVALGHSNVWRGTLHTEMFRGDHTEYFVDVGGQIIRARSSQDALLDRETISVGDEVFVAAPPHELTVLPGRAPGSTDADGSADRAAGASRSSQQLSADDVGRGE